MVAANVVLMYIVLQSRSRMYEVNEPLSENDKWNLNKFKNLLNLVMYTYFAQISSDRYTVSEGANRNFVNTNTVNEN